MTHRLSRSLGVAVLLVALAVAVRPAQAQQWAQNVQVVTSVKSEQPTRIFLDSLVNEIKARDTLRVKRDEEADERMELSAIQDALLEEGIGLFSANQLFIEYAFRIRDNEFIEVIQSVQFIFRPQSSGEQDVPILYMEGDNPALQEVLRSQGIPNPENLQSIALFKDELSFASLSLDQGADIVAVGGTPIRGEFDERRKAVLQRFKLFIYNRDKVYVTKVQ